MKEASQQESQPKSQPETKNDRPESEPEVQSDKVSEQPKKGEEPKLLTEVKALRAEQEAVKLERAKLEQDKAEFSGLIKKAETEGRSMVSVDKSKEDKLTDECNEMLKTTGMKI